MPSFSIATALPWSFFKALAIVLGYFWFYILRIRKRVGMENLSRVYGAETQEPKRQKILRASMIHALLYIFELLRVRGEKQSDLQARVQLNNVETVHLALEHGRGAIIVTPHIGCIDLYGIRLAQSGLSVAAVVRKVGWSRAERFMSAVRHHGGMETIAARKGGRAVMRALKENKVVVLVPDQHMPPRHGIASTFFGQLVSTSPAAVRIALKKEIPLLLAYGCREGFSEHHQIKISPALDMERPYSSEEKNIRHNVERINRLVESWLLQEPEQWLWVHRRWKIQAQWQKWDIPEELQHLVPKES